MTDEMVDTIPKYRESGLFTHAEKAAMNLADAMAGDHKHVRYGVIFTELRKYYTEEEVVTLCWKVGIWLGHGRLVHVSDVPAVGAWCIMPAKTTAG